MIARFAPLGRRPPFSLETRPPLAPDASGVDSNGEHPVTEVRGADGSSGNTVPSDVTEPERGQVPENGSPERAFRLSWVCRHASNVGDVLDEYVARSNLANDSPHLAPQSGFDVFEAGALACRAGALAGEAAGDEVNAGCWNPAFASTCKLVIVLRGPPFMRPFIAMWAAGDLLSSFATGVGSKRTSQPSDVIEHRHSGPPLAQQPSAELVGLAEPSVLPAGEGESVVEQAGSAEQRSAGWHMRLTSS